MSGAVRGGMRWTAIIGLTVVITATGSERAGAGGERPAPGTAAGAAFGHQQQQRSVAVRVVAFGCSGHAVGSGTIVPDGRVVTNRHVIAGADYVEIQTADGRRIGAAVQRVGREVDLAELWVGSTAGPGVVPAGRLTAGSPVRVLGHPRGGLLTGSEGRVSGRAVYDIPGMRATVALIDAAVAPGNSGGPAFDAQGRFVGVIFGFENNTRLAVAVDGDLVAGFLAGDYANGDPHACEPEGPAFGDPAGR